MTQGPKIPKRFWWTKRIFAGWLLVVVASLVIPRYWWNHLAQQRLSDELAAIHARGERVDWLNMSPPRLPAGEQNAAVYYRQAFAAMPALQGNQGMLLNDFMNIPSFRARHSAEVEAMLAANAAAFDLCRQARSMPGVDWGIVHTSPAFTSAVYNHYSPSRELGKLLQLRALWQAEHGDSAGAIETLRDCEALARATGGDDTFIGYMVSLAIQALNANSFAEIVPQLNTTTDPAATQPADVQAMRTLLAQMLDDSPLTSLPGAISQLRAEQYDVAEWVLAGGSYRSAMGTFPWYCQVSEFAPARWLLAPMRRVEQARMLTYFRDLLDGTSQPGVTLPPQQSQLDYPGMLSRWMIYRLQLTAIYAYPQYSQALRYTYGALANRRMAAIALALRLFELDKGRPANSLDQLVPEYLPSVPRDPFDPAGGRIRALLSDPKRRLYSLGENNLDDGGVTTRTTSGRQSDIVLFLRPSDNPEKEPLSPLSEPASEPSTAP